MKVLGILLIIFVSNANSGISDLNLNQGVSSLLCKTGVAVGSVASQGNSKCSDLSGNNNPLVKTVSFACGATTGVVDVLSKILKICCRGGSQDPTSPSKDPTPPCDDPSSPSKDPSPPSKDPSSPSKDPSSPSKDPSSPSQDPSSSSQDPSSPSQNISSSTQEDDAETTTPSSPIETTTAEITSTETETTPTTEPPMTTTPKPCTEKRIKECTERCKREAQVDLNLGGICSRYAGDDQRCDCILVRHCESYENATCTMQCKNKEICRIPEANIPCVCKTPNGKYTTYRVPESKFE